MARVETPLAREAALLDDTLRSQRDHLEHLRVIGKAPDPFREVPGDPHEWAFASVAKVTLLLLASVVLLGIGIQSVARILMASGVPGFDKPAVAYLFAFVPVAAALALKNLSSAFTTERHRRRYGVAIGLLGVLFGLGWSTLFVLTFPPIGLSIEQLISAVAGATSTGSSSGKPMMLFQLVAEIFLSAGLWLESERIVELHRPAGKLPNPAYAAVRQVLDESLRDIQRTEELLGPRLALLKEIDARRTCHVAERVALFLETRRFAAFAVGHAASRGLCPALPQNPAGHG